MGGTAVARGSLWRLPALRALVAVTVLGFASYCLTLAALPSYAVAGGAAESAAGVVTAVFLGATIVVQSAVPALAARFGEGPVLAAGLVALGAPSPLYVLGNGLGWLSLLSGVRGAGFGVLTVLGATLTARVAPPGRRGEAIGLYGLSIAVPNLLAVPGGVALVLGGHTAWLAWLAAAPVLAVPLVRPLARAVTPPAGEERGGGRRAVRASVAPSLVLLAVTLAGGGVLTFVPIDRPDGALATVALLVMGVTSALARWRAGVLADRVGARALLPASLAAGVAGLCVLAAGLHAAGAGGDAAVLAGAALVGVCYGAVQNLTLVVAFARAGAAGTTAASAVWNACFDAGTGLGALLLGFAVAGVGLPWTLTLVALLVAATAPVAVATTRG